MSSYRCDAKNAEIIITKPASSNAGLVPSHLELKLAVVLWLVGWSKQRLRVAKNRTARIVHS